MRNSLAITFEIVQSSEGNQSSFDSKMFFCRLESCDAA